MPVPPRSTALSHTVPALQAVASGGDLLSSTLSSLPSCTSFPLKQGDVVKTTKEARSYRGTDVPGDSTTDSAQTTKFSHPKPRCPHLLLPRMQQAGISPVSLLEATPAVCGTRGLSSPNEDGVQVCIQEKIVPSVCEVTSSTFNPNSVLRLESNQGKVETPRSSSAPKGAATGTSSEAELHGTLPARSVETQKSNATSHKLKSPVRATSANMAVAGSLSSSEAQKASRFVGSDALSCSSSCSLSDTPAFNDQADNSAVSTTGAAVPKPHAAGDRKAASRCSPSVTSEYCHSTNPTPATGGSTLCTLSPRSGEASKAAIETAYVSSNLLLTGSNESCLAADAQKKMRVTTAASSNDATTVRGAAGANKEANHLSGSVSLVNDGLTIPKQSSANDKRQTAEAPPVSAQLPSAVGEAPRQRDTATSAAQISPASSADKPKSNSVSGRLGSAGSAAVLTSPSVAHKASCVLHPSALRVRSPLPTLHSQFIDRPAAPMDFSGDDRSSASCRVDRCDLEEPFLNLGKLTDYSGRAIERSEAPHCVQREENIDACPEAVPVNTAPAGGRTGSGPGRRVAAENEALASSGISRSHSTPQSLLESFIFADGSQDKREHPLLPMPPATAETPSTVTSSNSASSASASCSPASSSPSVKVVHKSEFASTSNPPSIAQQCRCEIQNSDSLSFCKDPFRPSVNSATSTTIAFSAQLSGLCPISSNPAFAFPPSSAQQAPVAFSRRLAGMFINKEDSQATNKVMEECTDEGVISESEKPALSSKPQQTPVESTSEELHHSITASQSTWFATSDRKRKRAVGLHAGAASIPRAEVGRNEAILTVSCLHGTEHSLIEPVLATEEPAQLNIPHTRPSTKSSSSLCFRLHSPFQPAARSAPVVPPEPALPPSLATNASSERGGPSSNTVLKVGLPAAPTGARGDGVVRSVASIVVDGMLTASPIEAGDDGQTLPPTPAEAAEAGRGVGESSHLSRGQSSAAGLYCMPRNFLTQGTTSEARGSPYHRGGVWNASTLKVRCLLAASLRSIFKMLIKRVRRQQHQLLLDSAQNAGVREMGKEVADDELLGSKRQRLDQSQGKPNAVPGFDAYASSGGRASFRDPNVKQTRRLHVATTSARTFIESDSCAAALASSALKKQSTSTSFEARPRYYCACGSHRERETVPKEINKAESSRCRAWKMEGGRCDSLDTVRTRHCSSDKLHKDVPISRTAGRACDCSTSIPIGCCQPVSTSVETGMPAREMFCRNPCPCGVKGSRCLRNSKQTSSQETASLAEQQLLAAYRECFLLLSAAERKEELYIFEFVLLGGSCQYEATSLPSDENSACTINDHKGGVGERSRRYSHHVLEHVGSQRCEEGLPRTRYKDTVAASPSEAALLQEELSRNVSSAETAHMPKIKPTIINEGAQCAQIQGDVGRACGGGNARLQQIPAGSSDADVRTSKMRKRIALHPEKWDAKKIHYVLAALDGLRDAWRQGSSTTRAKAQIIESMFTPLPQGLQPRILQLAQRTQTGGPIHHAQNQRLMRFSPLQKFFEFHQVLNPNASSAATRAVSKSVMGPFTPLSSSEDTGSLDLSGSADRGLPSPHQPTRAHTSVERKRCSRVCAGDGKAYSRDTASDTECSETRAGACCCGKQGCYPNPVHSDRIFSNRSCAPASTLCPNYGPEEAACERHQEGALSSGVAHENWKGICATPATHQLWESHATQVPSSGSRLRLPASTDALLLEKECVASRTGGRRQPSAHAQREYYKLRQPDAFTNHSSVTAVSSSAMTQIATTSLLHCTRSGTLQQDPAGRDDTTCDGCNGGAESLAASSLRRSGECTASGEKVKGLRRGKLRSTTNRNSAVDDSRDIYKKPRPSVVSRRVLLQRKLQQQHGQSTSHATETSESDFESMSDIASSTQHGKTPVVRSTSPPLDTNPARFADTINGNRSPSGREEGQLPELNEPKLAVEAAAEKQHAPIILGDDHALGRPQSRRKSNSDTPASSSASFQQIQLFSQTLPSDICSSPKKTLSADQHKANTHALTETPESPTGAAPSVTKGEPLVDARRTSRRVSLVAEEMRRVRDICLNAGIKLSTSVATKDESRLVVSSIPQATSNTRDLPSLLESLQGQSLGLDAQDQTNLSDGVTWRSLRRSEEDLYGKAPEGALRSTGVAGSTLTMNSQQQTAAMRTTRHNKTKQPGVFQFTRGPKRFWAASWYADGHPGWKAFSVEKWGNREAFERARRAYEEKVPRKSREGGNVNGFPELVVSSVRGSYSPVSPDPDTFPADKAIRCGASSALKSTTCGIVHAGKRRASGTSEARNSNNAVTNAGGLTPVNTLTLSSELHAVENYPGHQPAVDVLRMRQEPRDLGDFLNLVGGSTRRMATKQDGRDSILVQREAQRARLQMGGNGELPIVVSEATASCGATIVSADSKEAQQLHVSSIRASSSESAASSQPETDWRQTAQQSKQLVGSSTQPCPSKHTGLFEAGSTVSSSYERRSGQQRCPAGADSLDLTQQGTLRELWNSCISEAGTLSLGAAFTCKEFSPSAYDSSSSSTGFELKAPAFSGSPRSSHLLRSPSRRAQGRGCRGIEQLMLSSVPSVNEDEECNSANKAGHRRDVGPNTSMQGQRKSHSEVHVPPEAELAAETYALLSPTEFLPITPENEDVTAQLLLVSSEDEISRGGDTYA